MKLNIILNVRPVQFEGANYWLQALADPGGAASAPP